MRPHQISKVPADLFRLRKLKSGWGIYFRKTKRLKPLEDFKRPLMSSSALSGGCLGQAWCRGEEVAAG